MASRVLITLTAFLVLATPAAAWVDWLIQCTGSQIEGTVGVFNQYVEGDVSGYDIVIEKLAIGTCEEPEIVFSTPLHDPFHYVEIPFSQPAPLANQNYQFQIYIRYPDGHLRPLIPGPAWYVASCGEAVEVRGFITSVNSYGWAEIQPCPGDCDTWPCLQGISLYSIPEEKWLPFVGSDQPVDIYGDFVYTPMAGDSCLNARSLYPAASEDCGIVAEEGLSWDCLKAYYR